MGLTVIEVIADSIKSDVAEVAQVAESRDLQCQDLVNFDLNELKLGE